MTREVGAVICEHGVVVQGVADGPAGELAGDAALGLEPVVDVLDAAVVEQNGLAFWDAEALEEGVVDLGLDVDEELVHADDVDVAGLGGVVPEGDAAFLGRGEVVLALALAGEFQVGGRVRA